VFISQARARLRAETRDGLSQIFAFFVGFLFQSIQVTFVLFGFGGVAVLAVRHLV
jgi:Microsomal signal peptidase 12 kDa subunit (SPC12)